MGSDGALRRALARLGCAWLGLGVSGCMRLGYDELSAAQPVLAPFGDLTTTSVEASSTELDAGSQTALRVTPERAWRDRDLLPLRESGSQTAPSFIPDASAADGGVPSTPAQPCVLSGNEQVVSGFDAPTAGLEARGPGSPALSWTGSEGSPSPGAMEFFNATPGGGEVYYPGTLGDLRNRIMSLNVHVAEGSGTRVRLFLESGVDRRRARAAFRTPASAQWDCAQVDPDAPAVVEAGFDPADVVGAGLEIEASAEVRVLVDQIAY